MTNAKIRTGTTQATTRERIVTSAEALFAENGFAGTSIRSIVTHAGVNLAAIHYHFGSKDELIVEVLAQNAQPVNDERLRRLDELEAGSSAPSIEEVLECFVEPPLRAGQDPEGSIILKRLIALFHHGVDPALEQHFLAVFYPIAERFSRALTKAGAGQVSAEEVVWRLHFSVGALLYTMSHVDRIGGTLCRVRGDDPESVHPQESDEAVRQLVGFLAGGFRAPAAEHTSNEKRRN